MTYEHLSWHGGTKPPRTDIDSREQSDEPPAEYWEKKEAERNWNPNGTDPEPDFPVWVFEDPYIHPQ